MARVALHADSGWSRQIDSDPGRKGCERHHSLVETRHLLPCLAVGVKAMRHTMAVNRVDRTMLNLSHRARARVQRRSLQEHEFDELVRVSD